MHGEPLPNTRLIERWGLRFVRGSIEVGEIAKTANQTKVRLGLSRNSIRDEQAARARHRRLDRVLGGLGCRQSRTDFTGRNTLDRLRD